MNYVREFVGLFCLCAVPAGVVLATWAILSARGCL